METGIVMRKISVSQIKTFLTCSERYRLRYIDKVDEPVVGSALILGSAVHGTIEEFFNRRKDDESIDVHLYFHNEYDKLLHEAKEKGKDVGEICSTCFGNEKKSYPNAKTICRNSQK